MTQQRKCGLSVALILGLLVVGIPCYASAPQHEATAMIQVSSAVPSLLGDARQLDEHGYIRFVNTQLVLLRSPLVLDRALENADVARLPMVVAQQDKRAWLARELQVSHADNTEIVYVRIVTNSAEASERIINAVVDAYFNFIGDVARQANHHLIGALRIEERRQRQIAQTLQENIRRTLIQEAIIQGATAGVDGMSLSLAQGESLERDIANANAKLTTMRAQRRGIVERMEQPSQVPVSILVQLNPEIRVISAQREALVQQRERLVQQRESRAGALPNPDSDPRLMQIDRQIESLDARLAELTTDVDGRGLEAMRNLFRLQEEANLFQLDQEIRVQEILVEQLTTKHNEQLLKSIERAESVLDASFAQAQLERAHRTLDKIEDRIIAITTEQRAPGQITPLTRAVVSVVPSE